MPQSMEKDVSDQDRICPSYETGAISHGHLVVKSKSVCIPKWVDIAISSSFVLIDLPGKPRKRDIEPYKDVIDHALGSIEI